MSCLGAPRLRPLLPPHYHHPQSGRRQPQDVPEDPCAVDPESSHEPPSPPRALSPQPHISPPPPLTIASPVTGKFRSTVQQSAHHVQDTQSKNHPVQRAVPGGTYGPVSYTHLRAHETKANLVCRLLLEKKKNNK